MIKKKLQSKVVLGLAGLFTVLFVVPVVAQDVPAILEVSGKVTDAFGKAVENAVVKAVATDVSAVLTDAEGRYKFYLVSQKFFFTLRVCEKSYADRVSTPINPNTPGGKVKFDAVLEAIEQPPMKVEMKKFVSGVSISGKVTGVKAEDTGKYKILVYALTNQWYIHPYAENKDGRGYASIKQDGSWSIRTVNRKHHPYNLAILVVSKTYVPPAVIPAGEDAEQSLKTRIGKNLSAFQIILAPEGL